jgi:hypothetical protein
MVAGFDGGFTPIQNKSKFPQSESGCEFQQISARCFCCSDRCIEQGLRDTLD